MYTAEAAVIFLGAFFSGALLILLLRPLAARIGLVDRPGGHKIHDDHIPLVGGFAIYAGLLLAWLIGPQLGLGTMNTLLVAASGLLFAIGLVDDRFQLSVRLRLLMQVAAGLLLVYSNVVLNDLGSLLPGEPVQLGPFAVAFTIFATVGTINAMNMLDGVDGLAGLVSFVVLGLLAYAAAVSHSSVQLLLTLTVMGGVAGFLTFNMRHKGRERASVFMGDAGSTLLGFVFAYLLISLSQGEHRAIHPVTALWLFAVPLMDTVGIMLRRIWLGKSPFSADRGHLHHLLMDGGFRMCQAVLLIAGIQLVLGALGLAAQHAGVPDYVSFGVFLAAFAGYAYLIIRPWRAVPKLRSLHRRLDLAARDADQVFIGNLSPDTARLEVQNLLREARIERPFELYERIDPETGEASAFALIDAGSPRALKPLVRDLRRAHARIYRRGRPDERGIVIRQLFPRAERNDRRSARRDPTKVDQRRRDRRGECRLLDAEPENGAVSTLPTPSEEASTQQHNSEPVGSEVA